MNRRKMIIGGVAVFLLGAAVGGYAGYAWIWKPTKYVHGLMARAYASQYATMQFHEANYNEAKTALERYIKLLDEMSKVQDYWLDSNELYVDRGLAYGQLASLSEKANRIDEADIYWSKAEQNMKSAGWEDVSRKNIAKRINKLEAIWKGSADDQNK
jgi:hypothetical protein